LIRDLRASERMPGVDAVRIPGEGAHRAREERARDGVPIPPALRSALDALGAELGIEPIA